MDKQLKYQQIVKQLFVHYVEQIKQHPTPNVETELLLDDTYANYMVIHVGWFNQERNRDITLYLRVKSGKVWVEEDWLEHGITTDLIAAGIPKEDIVLGFQPPNMRPLTEFAVA